MRLRTYKKLKAVLDTDNVREYHECDFVGTRTIIKDKDNGKNAASYGISLCPKTILGTIHGLPRLMKLITDTDNSTSAFLSSHTFFTQVPSKAIYYICVW